MLVPDGADELTLLSRRYAASRHDSGRLGLTIVTSPGCNIDCPYCFEAKHPSLLDESVERAILRATRLVQGVQVCLDGPPAEHDRRRPLVSGKGTFWQIVENLHHAVDLLQVQVLFEILAGEGFAGRGDCAWLSICKIQSG